MKNTFLPVRAKRSLAIGLSSVLFLVGCDPASDETATIATSASTTNESGIAASGRALVSQWEMSTITECSSGGVELSWGNDANGNSTLDAAEVVQKEVTCHDNKGANDTAGKNTHFEISSIAAGNVCPVGGQAIKVGIKEGAGFKAGSIKSFNICNGADGVDGNGQPQVSGLESKIAQGKTLVKNTRAHLDNLINKRAYKSYVDSVEAVLTDESATGLYSVLSDAVAGALDVMNRSSTDYTAGLKVFLKSRGYSDLELASLTATLTGSQLTVIGLTSTLTGSTLDRLVIEHATRADIEGDSVERFHIQDYKVKNATHLLSPTTGAVSFVELRLAKGSLSWLQMVAAAENDKWDENSYRINANSKFVLGLSGVKLSTLDGSTSFTGNVDFNVDLHQGKLDNTLPAFDFNQAHLVGALWHKAKAFNVDLSVTLIPKKNGFLDPTFMTDEQKSLIETKLTEFKSTLTTSGFPVVFDRFTRDGATVERLIVDFANFLSQFDAHLRLSSADQFEKVSVDKVVVEAIRSPDKGNYYFDITRVAFKDGKEVARSISSSQYEYNIHRTLASQAMYENKQLKAFIYGFEIKVDARFDTYVVSNSTSVLPLISAQWAFQSKINKTKNPVDIQDITAKIDSNVDGVFDVTLSLKDIKEADHSEWERRGEVTANTSLLFKHNNGELLANFETWQQPNYYCNSFTYNGYGDSLRACLGGAVGGVKRTEINSVTFTDLNGAKFVLQFQDHARSEDFSAYVTVDGINVGKLVELDNGDYAVEFRDYERVKLINN